MTEGSENPGPSKVLSHANPGAGRASECLRSRVSPSYSVVAYIEVARVSHNSSCTHYTLGGSTGDRIRF